VIPELEVVAEPARARSLLHPSRSAILEALAEPSSAAKLARRLGEPRQRLNYHLRELEDQDLVRLVEEHRRGSASERIVVRSGSSYAISPAALGPLRTRPEALRDRFSSAYQIAVASQAIAELAALRADAGATGQALPTFTLEVDVRFADAAARHAFTEELAQTVAALVAKHHAETAPGGRTFRFYVGAYPKPKGA
jgi:DNA-binding transcriptional ArsR family regulator